MTNKEEMILQHFLYEMETWKRLLAFFQQETIYLKTRLAEVLNSSSDDDIVAFAERFQEDFIEQDRIQYFLCEELLKQHEMVEKGFHLDGKVFPQIIEGQRKLREDILNEERRFIKVKHEFSNYLIDR